MNREKAEQLRQMILKAILSLDDGDALQCVELFPAWKAGTAYTIGDRIRYDGKLYRCEQTHRAQADWRPDITPNLWTEVAEPGTIPVWKQPTGAQDSYMIGDRVWYPNEGDDVWVSTINYNVYAPGTGDLWTKE